MHQRYIRETENRKDEPVLRRVLTGPAGPYIATAGCYVPSVLLAFVVSDDVLSAPPSAAAFSRFMSAWIPMIGRATALSPLPEVVCFYFSVMWALIPFWIAVMFLIPEERMAPIERMRKRKYLLALLMPIFVPAVIYYWVTLPGSAVLNDLPGLVSAMLSSRSELALLGVVPSFIAVFIYLELMWLRRIPTLYFDRQTGKGESND
jgi:hypothetical protein